MKTIKKEDRTTMYDTIPTATLVRWLTLDLPADVLAEIDQEINTRKE